MRISDWSSDVCSSDLVDEAAGIEDAEGTVLARPWRRTAAETGLGFHGADGELDPGLVAKPGRQQAQCLAGRHIRSEERRVGKECVRRVDLGGRRTLKKQK